MFINYNFSVINELAFYVFIQKIKLSNSHYIITDSDGFIEGITSNLLAYTNIVRYSLFDTIYTYIKYFLYFLYIFFLSMN